MLNRRALIGMCLLFASTEVVACTCVISSTEERFRSADSVLAAEALEITNEPMTEVRNGREFRFHSQTVRWSAVYAWKGSIEVPGFFTTTTRVWNGSCGVSVTPGSSMLLFFSDDSPTPSVQMCMGSRKLSEAIWIIPELFRVSGVKAEPPWPWGPPNNSLKRTDQSLRD